MEPHPTALSEEDLPYRQLPELVGKVTELNREVGVLSTHQKHLSRRIDEMQDAVAKKMDEIYSICQKNDIVLDDLVKKNHLSASVYSWLSRNWLQVGIIFGFVVIEILYKNLPLPGLT